MGSGVVKEPPTSAKNSKPSFKRGFKNQKRVKYCDNKGRAVQAASLLLQDHPMFALRAKQDDLADALLQGLWVLWNDVMPSPPRRKRARKAQDVE